MTHGDLFEEIALHIEITHSTKSIEAHDGDRTLEELGIDTDALKAITRYIHNDFELRIRGLTLDFTLNQLVGLVLDYSPRPKDSDEIENEGDSDPELSSEQAIGQWTDISIAQSKSDPELLEEGITRVHVSDSILAVCNFVTLLDRTLTMEDRHCTLQQIGIPDDKFQGIIDKTAEGFGISLEGITPSNTINELVDEVFRLIFQ
ncbi:hypothetical protein HN358_01930 [Candidatus Uhrbacteria bacterium]|jgi:hypothetical protein|nr:hypothetical protein [Candidatus Uhrbacteria bacterium]MBT7716864.1 hypothetical protein [Candidatus Uhrbacteria bacterium]